MTGELLAVILSSASVSGLISGVFALITKIIDTSAKKKEREASSEAEIKAALRLMLYRQIRDDGLHYIEAGRIDPDDLKILLDVHKTYKDLDGDGYCDKIMADVNKLPLM